MPRVRNLEPGGGRDERAIATATGLTLDAVKGALSAIDSLDTANENSRNELPLALLSPKPP